MIIIILIVTIFFCHSVIRLCMMVVKSRKREQAAARGQLPEMAGPGGYAIPRQPIPVVLARDEEAAGIESEATKTGPPAYGVWRESVVCFCPVFQTSCCLKVANRDMAEGRPEPALLDAQRARESGGGVGYQQQLKRLGQFAEQPRSGQRPPTAVVFVGRRCQLRGRGAAEVRRAAGEWPSCGQLAPLREREIRTMDLNVDGDGHFRGVGVGVGLGGCIAVYSIHHFTSRASGAYQAYQAYVIVIARGSDQVQGLFVCSSLPGSVSRRRPRAKTQDPAAHGVTHTETVIAPDLDGNTLAHLG